MAANSTLGAIAPFFIVKTIAESIEFYNRKLGFGTDLLIPEEDPFFGIVSRDRVSIFLKEISEDILPVPNCTRHEWARWDAFVLSSDPDALFAEFQARSLEFHETLADTSDGLRAFELKDLDGYVLCFGKPL